MYLGTILLTLLFAYISHNTLNRYATQSADKMDIHKAEVLWVDSIVDTGTSLEGTTTQEVYFTARIQGGEHHAYTVQCIQNIDNISTMQDMQVDVGDHVLLNRIPMEQPNQATWLFVSYNRTTPLLVLSVVFLLLIVVIGGKKGVSTIFSLLLTCLLIFWVYVPSILSGINIYASTLVVGTIIIFMSLLLINGANKKTLCAILGNLAGVLIAALLTLVMSHILKLTGVIDEHYVYLAQIGSARPLNPVAIIWGGMVLGSLGAIMDVAMSIASAMYELAEHMQYCSFTKLLKSGMNIGRDAIGTMTNTLILAYIGGSLALVLLLIVNTKDIYYLFSLEMISVQVVQSVVGSMGILFAVPFTAVIAAYIYSRTQNKIDA